MPGKGQMAERANELAIGLVLAPAFGEKGSFIPLGLAYLNGALREEGYVPSYHDISARVREREPALYAELVRVGFSPDKGGFFGPELELLLAMGQDRGEQDTEFAATIVRVAEEAAASMEKLDLALITLWDSNLYFAAALGRALRARGSRVVFGGPGAQLSPLRDLLCRMGCADAVLIGEGEERVVTVAKMVSEGVASLAVPGATIRDADGAIKSFPEPPALRIHDLPRPDFEGLGVEDWVPVITSRGCIRDCSFCTEKDFWSRYRQRKVEDVIEELAALRERYGIHRFEFNDDLLNGHPKWLERFCDALIEKEWGLRWICFMEPYRLTPAVLDKVAAAGCTLIKYGVQHFDVEMLRSIGRGAEIGEVVSTLKATADRGIRVHFDLIPGHPMETVEHHQTNLRILPEVLGHGPLLEVNINPFLLLYGAPVEKNPAQYGVAIERWSASELPPLCQESLGDLAGSFIRSYQQEPTREVVIERTAELENLVQKVRGQRVFPSLTITGEGLDHERSKSLRKRGIHRVVLRPGEGATPRHLLEGISQAKEDGFTLIAMATGGSPFDRVIFVKEALERGLTYAILEARGDGEELIRAGQLLGAAGIRWVLEVAPAGNRIFECRAWVERAVQSNAHGVYLALDHAMGGPEAVSVSEAAIAARRALEHGEALGIGVYVYGLPYCTLAEQVDAMLSGLPWERGEGVSEIPVAQVPACRACVWANKCPGGVSAALGVESGTVLAPVEGRPIDEEGRDAIDRLFG